MVPYIVPLSIINVLSQRQRLKKIYLLILGPSKLGPLASTFFFGIIHPDPINIILRDRVYALILLRRKQTYYTHGKSLHLLEDKK